MNKEAKKCPVLFIRFKKYMLIRHLERLNFALPQFENCFRAKFKQALSPASRDYLKNRLTFAKNNQSYGWYLSSYPILQTALYLLRLFFDHSE